MAATSFKLIFAADIMSAAYRNNARELVMISLRRYETGRRVAAIVRHYHKRQAYRLTKARQIILKCAAESNMRASSNRIK